MKKYIKLISLILIIIILGKYFINDYKSGVVMGANGAVEVDNFKCYGVRVVSDMTPGLATYTCYGLLIDKEN